VFHEDPFRIYYDSSLLNFWDTQYGTPLPSDIFVAHEMGHTIQNGLGLAVIHQELQADCLAGFFLGWRTCLGEVSQNDITATFNNFCAIGTSSGATWFNPSVHGSCIQRVSAVQQGMTGYQRGLLPGQACPL
jgi:predicted metalloprotease